MRTSYRARFNAIAGATALAASVVFLSGTFANASAHTPQELEAVPACQSFSAPLADKEAVEYRHNEAHQISEKISQMRKEGGHSLEIDELEKKKNILLLPNILNNLRRELTNYTGWNDLMAKLSRNGKELHEVCLSPNWETMLPVIMHSSDSGDSELDLNTVVQTIDSMKDGHGVERIFERNFIEIEEELTPNIANQAVYYLTLYGTTSPENPAFRMEYDAEDIVMLWTTWNALASAEQMLHAADYHVRTGDIRSFDASYDIQPYQHYLVSELSLMAMEHRKYGTNFSAEDRLKFKQKSVREALQNREVRLRGFQSILDVVQNQDAPSNSDFFSHIVTDKELAETLHRLDPDIVDMPIRKIYSLWENAVDDPAEDIIQKLGYKNGAGEFKQPSPAPQ